MFVKILFKHIENEKKILTLEAKSQAKKIENASNFYDILSQGIFSLSFFSNNNYLQNIKFYNIERDRES